MLAPPGPRWPGFLRLPDISYLPTSRSTMPQPSGGSSRARDYADNPATPSSQKPALPKGFD